MMPGQLSGIRVYKLSTAVAAFNVTIIGIKDLEFAFSCDAELPRREGRAIANPWLNLL